MNDHAGSLHERWHRRWHRRFRRSLHWRLLALFLLLALAGTAVFVAGTQRIVAGGYELFVRPLLADYADRLAAEIGTPPDVQRAAALVERLPIAIRIDGPMVHWNSRDLDPWRGRHPTIERLTADGHRLAFSINTESWSHHGFAGFVPVLGLLLVIALAYAVVRRMFRPLDDIRSGAQRYEGGDFSQPIPVRRRDDLGELAHRVNAMAQGLQGMLRGQRELLLAISHELRSPLTRARLNAELLAEAPERDALLRDLALMRELISGLLEGERLAAGSAALHREACDLNALLRGVIDEHFGQPVGEHLGAHPGEHLAEPHAEPHAEPVAAQPIALRLAERLPALQLDPMRVQMLLRNLLDNALRHGAAGGRPVTVTTALVGEPGSEQVRLTVRDHGPGVDEAQLARLAEPFYRPEGARTRATGGVGLGLYLCRLVAQSHGAGFTLRNAAPGLEVQIDWPVPAA